jgi:hypothetical protein
MICFKLSNGKPCILLGNIAVTDNIIVNLEKDQDASQHFSADDFKRINQEFSTHKKALIKQSKCAKWLAKDIDRESNIDELTLTALAVGSRSIKIIERIIRYYSDKPKLFLNILKHNRYVHINHIESMLIGHSILVSINPKEAADYEPLIDYITKFPKVLTEDTYRYFFLLNNKKHLINLIKNHYTLPVLINKLFNRCSHTLDCDVKTALFEYRADFIPDHIRQNIDQQPAHLRAIFAKQDFLLPSEYKKLLEDSDPMVKKAIAENPIAQKFL